MAKKKPAQHDNQEHPTTEDQSETIANLKSLNKMLVKETVERRGEISSLLQSKQELEAAIVKLQTQGSDRSFEDEIQRGIAADYVAQQKEALEVMVQEKRREIEELAGEFKKFRDEAARDLDLKRNEVERLSAKVDELEKSNVEVRDENDLIRRARDEAREEKRHLEEKIENLETAMAGIAKEKDEIERSKTEREAEVTKLRKELGVIEAELKQERSDLRGVVSERDEVRKSLDDRVVETERLRLQVVELERCNTATEEELGKVRLERRRLVEESERKLEVAVKEKGVIEGSLTESMKSIKDLESNIEDVSREKKEVERERAQLVARTSDLETEVNGLKETVSGLRNRELELAHQVNELGVHNSEANEAVKNMQLELGKMGSEKNEIEKKYDSLVKESSLTSQKLDQALLQLEAEKEKLGAIVVKMADVEEVKKGLGTEIENLQEQVAGLRKMVSTLEKSLQEQVETNGQIQSEAMRYKTAHDSVTLERDDVKKEFSLQKKEEERLRTVVRDLEKGIEETRHDHEQFRNKLSKEAEEMKSLLNTLTKEKIELQKKLVKADDDIKALVSSMKSSKNQNEQILSMVKSTVEVVSRSLDGSNGKEDVTIDAEKMTEEVKPLVVEFEAIRRSFMNEKEKVDDLNKQIESLKSQMEQLQKKNGLVRLLPYALALAGAVAGMALRAR